MLLGKFYFLLAFLNANLAYALYSGISDRTNLSLKGSMKKLSDCSASFDDGSIMDLSALDDTQNPLLILIQVL